MTLAPAPAAVRDDPTERLRRLADLSVRRAVEPDTEFAWGTLGTGAVLPDELLSIHGLAVDLTPQQRTQLSREEVAAMLAAGIRFEAMLDAILSLWVAHADDLRDPRFPYLLHEVAEETRHQRAFLRLLDELGATAANPLDHGLAARARRRIARIAQRERAFFCVMLLAGEEIPDHLQELASEHADTAPLLRAINRYHRAEEARHLSFARMLLPDLWARAGHRERFRVRRLAPRIIQGLFESMVHPGVYATVGLPGFRTWRAAHRTSERVAIRHVATRPVLDQLLLVGAFPADRVPRGWRRLCGVDHTGTPVV